MQDFDVERRKRHERAGTTFTIAGREFRVYPAILPEVLADYQDGLAGASHAQYAALLDRTIKEVIVEADHEKWDEARRDKTDPITLFDMATVMRWLIERQTDRPTEAPSPSSGGRAKPEASSTDASSSPEEAQAA